MMWLQFWAHVPVHLLYAELTGRTIVLCGDLLDAGVYRIGPGFFCGA
jgi:hypothetical protein